MATPPGPGSDDHMNDAPMPRLKGWGGLRDFMRELHRRGYSEDEITELTAAAVDKLPVPRHRPRRIATGISVTVRDLPRCSGDVDCRAVSWFAVTDTATTTQYRCWRHIADRFDAQAQPQAIERIDYAPNKRAAAHGRTEWVLTLTPVDAPCQMQFF